MSENTLTKTDQLINKTSEVLGYSTEHMSLFNVIEALCERLEKKELKKPHCNFCNDEGGAAEFGKWVLCICQQKAPYADLDD